MTSNPCNILKEFFEEVKAGNVSTRRTGLCSNLSDFCISRRLSYHEISGAGKLLRSLMYTFPKYTGDPVYPLVLVGEYSVHLLDSVDFYDPATSYGAIRLEFVDWALKELA